MDRKSVDIFSKLNGRKRDDLKASRRERPHKTTVRLTLGFVVRRRAHLLMKRVYTACVCLYILCFTMETFESQKERKMESERERVFYRSIESIYFLSRRGSVVRTCIQQPKRILRPLVPDTLFRASSLRTRSARGNEPARRRASG